MQTEEDRERSSSSNVYIRQKLMSITFMTADQSKRNFDVAENNLSDNLKLISELKGICVRFGEEVSVTSVF